jgi:hypothetical protein
VHQLAYICRGVRWLFRECVWLEVAKLLAINDDKACNMSKTLAGSSAMSNHTCLVGCMEMNVVDAYRALQNTNWCAVHTAHQVLVAATCTSTPAKIPNPICVVMLRVNIACRPSAHIGWSNEFINDIVQKSVKYGTIHHNTHVIVQIFFDGLCQTPHVKKALCVIVIDSIGMGYCYNVPRGDCEHIAFRCVTRILQLATGCVPSILNSVVCYSPRTPYDDCLYAMYITAACSTEHTKSMIRNIKTPCSDLISCRPSAKSARPTRIVANMRLLMLLCQPICTDIVDGLLLDEINILDEFRLIALNVHVSM